MESGEQRYALARELVLTYGWNSTAYQILNPGIEHWFAAGNTAVVGYTRRGHVLLAAGSPVCAAASIESVCEQFEAFASAQGCSVCYVCADERLPRPGHSVIAMGAQPVWNPQNWPRLAHINHSLRCQLNRSRNKNVVVEAVDTCGAGVSAGMRRVLDEWLKGRTLPQLHFLVEPEILTGEQHRRSQAIHPRWERWLRRFRRWVFGEVERQSEGLLHPPTSSRSSCNTPDRVILVARRWNRIVAFLVASPIPARNGYLVELLARSRAAPNGTSELLIDTAMRRFAEAGREYATLGLVALAHAADAEMSRNPIWLRAMMQFARAHANRFYNFRGLEHFRTKLAPQRWEPVYAVSSERRFSLQTLYAMGAAFSGIPPWLAVGIGLAKAARSEFYCALHAMPRVWFWFKRLAIVDPTSARKASRSGGLYIKH